MCSCERVVGLPCGFLVRSRNMTTLQHSCVSCKRCNSLPRHRFAQRRCRWVEATVITHGQTPVQARGIFTVHHRAGERGTRPTEWYRGDCPMAPRSRSSSAPTHGAANRTTDGTTRGKWYRGQQERVRRAGHSRSEGTNFTTEHACYMESTLQR